MGEKASYQYFSNISQRINRVNDAKSNSNENLRNLHEQRRAPTSRSNGTLNQSWFATLTGGRRGRPAVERGKRQNSCTSSEAGSLNLEGSNSLNKSFSNSFASKNGSVDEKADTISNLNDAREANSCDTAVTLRNSTKSNRSANRTVQELRKQSKEVDDSESAYYRYSSPEPFDLVPSQLFIEQYLEYLRENNLELNFDQLNLAYLNYLNQLNLLNQVNQLNELRQFNQQLNPIARASQLNHLNQPAQPNQVNFNQPNSSDRPNCQFNLPSLPVATSQPFLPSPFALHSNQTKTSSANSSVSSAVSATRHAAESKSAGRQRTSEAASSATTEQQSDNKPQLVQCPQLATKRVGSSDGAQLSESSNEHHEQPPASERQAAAKQTDSANQQPICDELRKFESLQLAASESDSKKSKKFKLVKELFDADAHLYMSVEQMTAMEELIRNNPRTCVIYLSNTNEELGFNLITKKKPHFAHIVKKVNQNLVSAKAGLQENDQLLMVNGVDCRSLAHQQVVKLLGKRERKLKLVVCQPSVYQWYLNEGYELKLDYDVEQDENEQANEQDRRLVAKPEQESARRKQLSELNEPQRSFDYQPQPPIKYNERCVDDARPVQALPDQGIPFADNYNSYKDNRINSPASDDPLSANRNSGFKRSYKLKKKPAQPFADDAVDDSLSMSTSVSPFDEKYGELRDEIFNPSQSLKSSAAKNRGNQNSNLNSSTKNYPTSLSNKNLADNYNYESKKLEYNEYMDSEGAHKLEKSETLVEIQNDEFKNKKVTRRSVEKLHKNYDDQPMKNVLPTSDSKPSVTDAKSSEKATTRSPYTPVYGKTSLFSNSLFDKPKTTTTSLFDKPKDRPTSIFDRPSIFDRLNTSDQVASTSKTSYSSPTYGGKTLNTSTYNNQTYSSQSFSKNESSSYSKSYISPTSKYATTSYKSPYDDNRQTLVKEPLVERHVIEPKAAQLVHIYDDQEPVRKETKPLRTQQAKSPVREPIKPLRTVQANSANDLPSPRLCTLKLPRDRIVSFGFTIKTSRKTNAKLVVDIVRNSIAHRAGLRVNDIIVEVNEAFVGQDTHQQCTDRIKAHAADEVRLLVVTEAEMEIYRNHGLVPSSEQDNVIHVEFDSELMMPMHLNEADEEDCLKGCGSFLDNLTAKQYRTYLQSSKKRPEPANSPQEFQEKIKKFEKL